MRRDASQLPLQDGPEAVILSRLLAGGRVGNPRTPSFIACVFIKDLFTSGETFDLFALRFPLNEVNRPVFPASHGE